MIDPVEVIPLGGVGEFGMNCCAIRHQGAMVVVDAGISFARSSIGTALGVDYVVPDITFLRDNRSQIKAIVLTHGHEDHAGSVAYILNEIPVPVYGSRLTLGMVSNRLKDRGLSGQAELISMEARQSFRVGPFQIEPLNVTHSFPNSFCLAIRTQVGTLMWSGDFKFDQTPIDGQTTDMARLAEYGEEGVLALFSDSTNSESPGLCPSESEVAGPLANLFSQTDGRIIVSTFASSIHRLQVVCNLATSFGRKVVLAGRSMLSNVRVARELGHLSVPSDLFVADGEAGSYNPNRLLILATGSQGEPMSALNRLALNEFRGIEVNPEDRIILSARIIPGNQKSVANMLNHFYRRGARAYTPGPMQIHVSGHGFQDDLKLMINLTKPRYFIPVHGDYRQLRHHAWIAEQQGIESSRVFVIENGSVLVFGENSAEVSGEVPVGRRFIDEGVREEIHDLVLRDRRFLSEDGFVVIVIRMDQFSGEIIEDPDLISRGFVQIEESDALTQGLREEIRSIVAEIPKEERQDEEVFKEILRKQLRRYLRKRTGKRPLVLPITLEV